MRDKHDILVAMALEKSGDYFEIFKMLQQKIDVDEAALKKACDLYRENTLTLIDQSYPEEMKVRTVHPPIVLFYKGDISLLTKYPRNHYIGVVGSRKSTFYGINSVRYILKGLPKDTVIVSGLAVGIDRVAHECALEYGLKTIAVLPCGFDHLYPPENADIYKRIIENGGLVISEYPDFVEASAEKFTFRNRIVAGLSGYVLVGEAYERSGTSVTVNYALTCGIPVGCIPYPILNFNKSMCNELIRDGAFLVSCPEDLIFQAGLGGK